MKTYKVESSNIEKIGYNLETEELTVTFKSGCSYLYKQVKSDDVCGLMFSDSIGNRFHNRIKKYHDCEAVL